jgi:D-sedoheptulose 7-phosphate isomerase
MGKTDLIKAIVKAHKSGFKVLIAGNGGLAAESEHFAAELVGKFAFDVYVPCIALTTNTSLITAIANDLGFEDVFAHQIKTIGKKGDIFIAMTTSRSPNIVKALEVANKGGLFTVAVCGIKSGDLGADLMFSMQGEDTATIQENAIRFLHQVAYDVKRELR